MDPMTDTEVPTRGENESASAHAVFVDIDGTLCDSRQRIPVSALEALAQVRSRGHRLFACTGRSAPEVYPRFWEVGFAEREDTPASGTACSLTSACPASTSMR